MPFSDGFRFIDKFCMLLQMFSLTMIPFQGTEETVRVVSMDKDFHVDCYHCEVSYVGLGHPSQYSNIHVLLRLKKWINMKYNDKNKKTFILDSWQRSMWKNNYSYFPSVKTNSLLITF